MRLTARMAVLLVVGHVCAVVIFIASALPGQQKSSASTSASPSPVPENYAPHPAPAQPLPYSHKRHLALGLQCKMCHANPDPGKLMTFPETSTCMGCHAGVAKDKPAIRQLADFAKSAKPIPWVRVYAITTGVTWTHRKHVDAGVKCETCHGPVAQMDAMSMTTSVTSMGVCIGCHEQNKAATTCQTCHIWPSSN